VTQQFKRVGVMVLTTLALWVGSASVPAQQNRAVVAHRADGIATATKSPSRLKAKDFRVFVIASTPYPAAPEGLLRAEGVGATGSAISQ
jgi:hypothetical protein